MEEKRDSFKTKKNFILESLFLLKFFSFNFVRHFVLDILTKNPYRRTICLNRSLNYGNVVKSKRLCRIR